MMRPRLLSAAALLCLASLAYAADSGRPGGRSLPGEEADSQAKLSGTFRTAYFIVHHDPADPYLAKLMTRGATEHIRRIARDLGCKLDSKRPFRVYIYPNHMDFIRAGGLEARKFTVGTAADNEVISVDASGVFESADRVMAHEITHAVVFRLLGRRVARVPLWFNEGLAKHMSEQYADNDLTTVANAAADGSLIPLSELRDSFPEKRTDVAYAQSHLAVRYLVRKYGDLAPRRVLAEVARGWSFDEAMSRALGAGLTAFEADWYRSATRKYRPLRLAQLVGALVSALMAALAVAAFLVRRRQKIEAARRWEEEEFDERMRRLLGEHRHR